jgi:hypothetical protein
MTDLRQAGGSREPNIARANYRNLHRSSLHRKNE